MDIYKASIVVAARSKTSINNNLVVYKLEGRAGECDTQSDSSRGGESRTPRARNKWGAGESGPGRVMHRNPNEIVTAGWHNEPEAEVGSGPRERRDSLLLRRASD